MTAPRHTPKNKGRESLAYLQYIVDHYDDLPSTIVFLHSHKDGWPGAWHTDTMAYSNVDSIRALQTDFVQRNGYVNLRCQQTPGCPDEIRPFRDPPQFGKTAERVYAQLIPGGDNKCAEPDARRAADALHAAMREMKRARRAMVLWVPFVHYGV